MKVKSEILIADLIEKTRKNLNQAEELKLLTEKDLNFKKSPTSWSVLECVEHLNLYGEYYLPEIKARIFSSKYEPSSEFKSGKFGNYFAKIMLPKEKAKKMKTPKDKNPNGSKLEKSVIDNFISQQQTMLQLLDKSRDMDLSKTKTSISISKVVKLRLGDTFRFVINHNDRHLAQANKILKNIREIA